VILIEEEVKVAQAVRAQVVDMAEEEVQLQVLKDIQMDSEVEEVIVMAEVAGLLSISLELELGPLTHQQEAQEPLEWVQ
jgi:hypothetical protein